LPHLAEVATLKDASTRALQTQIVVYFRNNFAYIRFN
jgi:hypothetical protein